MQKIIAPFISFFTLLLVFSFIPGPELSAQAVTFSFPFSETFTSCSGEEITINGISEFRISGSGKEGHFNIHSKVNAEGIGDQGNEYRLNQTDMLVGYQDGDKFVATSRVSGILVGKGKAPNIQLKWVDHVTVNANGELKGDPYNFNDSCK